MDTSGVMYFYGGDTAGTLNSATLNAAGSWVSASDKAYKENIEDLNTKYGLQTVLSMQPRYYTMKGSGIAQVGFIAQELEKVLPEVVSGTDGSKGISYGNIVAVVVQAIKDLNTKIEDVLSWFSGDKFNVKGDVCVDDTCVSKDQFKNMLLKSGGTTTTTTSSSATVSDNESTTTATTTETTTDTEDTNTTTTKNEDSSSLMDNTDTTSDTTTNDNSSSDQTENTRDSTQTNTNSGDNNSSTSEQTGENGQ